ncbi:MAG: helix-turn-helix domain-containing protein [Roseburia sp.]|nr:helix-turn-helix domain-containing protein [Roseburia sp.]
MMSKFSENLKEARHELGISQAELAKRLDLTLKTVSHWETGYSEPSIQQILDLADFFHISTDELLK